MYLRMPVTAVAFAVFSLACVTAGAAEGLPSRIASPFMSEAPQSFKWTGAYIGGGIGHQWYDFNCDKDCHDDKDSFWFGDIKAGYDYRFGTGALVLGVFGTWSPDAFVGKEGVDNIYSIGGRIGLVLPNAQDTMIYVGGSWVRVEGFDTSADGWAVHTGFEKRLLLNLTWGIEYKYTDLSAGLPDNIDCDLTGHSVMARINLRFGG